MLFCYSFFYTAVFFGQIGSFSAGRFDLLPSPDPFPIPRVSQPLSLRLSCFSAAAKAAAATSSVAGETVSPASPPSRLTPSFLRMQRPRRRSHRLPPTITGGVAACLAVVLYIVRGIRRLAGPLLTPFLWLTFVECLRIDGPARGLPLWVSRARVRVHASGPSFFSSGFSCEC